MLRLKLLLVIAAVGALATTSLALAHEKPWQPRKAHTDPVTATFTLAAVRKSERRCVGQDGDYRVLHALYRGTSTGDPRLTGSLRLRSHGLVNQTTGYGSSRGTFALRDASSGRLLAHGRYFAVYTDGNVLHGFAIGRVKDRSPVSTEETDGSGALLGGFKARLNDAGTELTGQLGGTSDDNRMPAIVQGGGCMHRVKHRRAERRQDEKRKDPPAREQRRKS